MRQNVTVNLPSSNLPLSQGNCVMWQDHGRSQFQHFFPPLLVITKKAAKVFPLCKRNIFSVLQHISATQSQPMTLAARRATGTQVGNGSKGQASISSQLRHPNANKVISRSRAWKTLLSSVQRQTYQFTACICRQMDTTLQTRDTLDHPCSAWYSKRCPAIIITELTIPNAYPVIANHFITIQNGNNT